MGKGINLDINNRGVTITIEKQVDDFGDDGIFVSPLLVITASHFGHQTNQMKLHLNQQQMEEIGKWMISESNKINDWNNVDNSDIELSIFEVDEEE